jgi:hypothetical protein
VENQQAWNNLQVKELNLCLARINKAFETFDKIYKVLPISNPQNISGEFKMAIHHLAITKKIVQEQLEKRTS